MIVKLERYFKYPDLKRQTPGCSLKWNGFTFTEDDVTECDYLVILEYPAKDFSVKVNKDNILHVCQEPPNEVSKYRQYANKNAKLVFNQLDTKKNNILSHGALPWHVDKDYDFLSALKPTDLKKENKVVWITSNQMTSKGHNERMDFLNRIKDLPDVHLYGRGIRPIADKWTALEDAKYAIAYENFQDDYYWTEKIIDCYLSYTMPLYFGCRSIGNFFPKDSYIELDPNDKHIDLLLKETIASNKWEQSLEAITQARQLILEQYQLFPFLYREIKALEAAKDHYPGEKQVMDFKGGNAYFDNYPKRIMLEKNILKISNKIKKLF
jgi:hypothetical protein